MESLIALVPAAACAGGMYLCMRMMRSGDKKASDATSRRASESQPEAEIAQLREEVSRPREELRVREREPSA